MSKEAMLRRTSREKAHGHNVFITSTTGVNAAANNHYGVHIPQENIHKNRPQTSYRNATKNHFPVPTGYGAAQNFHHQNQAQQHHNSTLNVSSNNTVNTSNYGGHNLSHNGPSSHSTSTHNFHNKENVAMASNIQNLHKGSNKNSNRGS